MDMCAEKMTRSRSAEERPASADWPRRTRFAVWLTLPPTTLTLADARRIAAHDDRAQQPDRVGHRRHARARRARALARSLA